MIICKRYDHDGTNDDLAIDNDWSVFDAVHAYGFLKCVSNFGVTGQGEEADLVRQPGED